MDDNFDITEISLEELEGAKSILGDRFAVLVDGYLEDAHMYVNGVSEGLETGDLQKIASYAHPLKSSSAGVGLVGFSAIAKKVEEMAKTEASIEDIKPFLPTLREALEYVEPKLKEHV